MVARVRVTTRGTRSTNTECVSPGVSRTVRWIRYHTLAAVSPVVGMVKVPPVAPVVGSTKGWAWSAWWKSTRQVNAAAGRLPSSGSTPVPEYVNVSPPEYRVLWAGAVMVAVGAELAVTSRMAALLVAVPKALVTTARKVAPLSVSVTPRQGVGRGRRPGDVGAVALPLVLQGRRRRRRSRRRTPCRPTGTVTFEGCEVMVGAELSSNVTCQTDPVPRST